MKATEQLLKDRDPQFMYSYVCLGVSLALPFLTCLIQLSTQTLNMLNTLYAAILISSILVFKNHLTIATLVVLGYAEILQFYYMFLPHSMYYPCKVLLLMFVLQFDQKKKSGSVQLVLLSKEYHQYQHCPEKYVVQKMKSVKKWEHHDQEQLTTFFKELGGLYNEIPYHNLTHAFDVTVNLDKYLIEFGFLKQLNLNQEQRVYMLIAAYAHDAGHEGFTNNFYNNWHDELALKYSYISPLENLHCSNLMRTLRKYPDIAPQESKKLMVKVILSTDNFAHKETVSRLKNMKGKIQQQDKQFMLEVLLHTADINNPSKDLQTFLIWNQRLYQEFDKENLVQNNAVRQRRVSQIQRNQLGFLKGVVWPLYKELTVFSPKFNGLVDQIEKNICHFQKIDYFYQLIILITKYDQMSMNIYRLSIKSSFERIIYQNIFYSLLKTNYFFHLFALFYQSLSDKSMNNRIILLTMALMLVICIGTQVKSKQQMPNPKDKGVSLHQVFYIFTRQTAQQIEYKTIIANRNYFTNTIFFSRGTEQQITNADLSKFNIQNVPRIKVDIYNDKLKRVYKLAHGVQAYLHQTMLPTDWLKKYSDDIYDQENLEIQNYKIKQRLQMQVQKITKKIKENLIVEKANSTHFSVIIKLHSLLDQNLLNNIEQFLKKGFNLQFINFCVFNQTQQYFEQALEKCYIKQEQYEEKSYYLSLQNSVQQFLVEFWYALHHSDTLLIGVLVLLMGIAIFVKVWIIIRREQSIKI